jgi:hypothetical protein
MWLFTHPHNTPFDAALLLLLGLTTLEVVGLLLAFSPSGWLDEWLPDVHGADASGSGMAAVLAWLHAGQVPSLVLLILFLLGYALAGYGLQSLAQQILGHPVSVWAAGWTVVPVGLLTMGMVGRAIARWLPKEETSAVSDTSFLGRTAVVTTGTARQGWAAQARVVDEHGRTHFLMVEPETGEEAYTEGTVIWIVEKKGAFYRCTRSGGAVMPATLQR